MSKQDSGVYCKLSNYLEDEHYPVFRIIKQGGCWLGAENKYGKLNEAVFKKPSTAFTFLIPSKERLSVFRKLLEEDQMDKVFAELSLSVVDEAFDDASHKPKLADGTTLDGVKLTKVDDALVGPKDKRIRIYQADGEIKGKSKTGGNEGGVWCPKAQNAFNCLSKTYKAWVEFGGFGSNPLVQIAMCMKMVLEDTDSSNLKKVLNLVKEPRLFPFVVVGPNSPFVSSCADVDKLQNAMRKHLSDWTEGTFIDTHVSGSDDKQITSLDEVLDAIKEHVIANGWEDDVEYGMTLFELNYRAGVRFTLAQKSPSDFALVEQTTDIIRDGLMNKSDCFRTTLKLIPSLKKQGFKIPQRLFKGEENIRGLVESIHKSTSVDKSKLDEVAAEEMLKDDSE